MKCHATDKNDVLSDFSERFLYHIWDAGHLKSELQTVSGKNVKIISPGRISSSAGPDFREAVVSIGGDILHGDVEIHKTTYDWQVHGHQDDPNYCNMILHVVFKHNTWQEYTIDKKGNVVEILELKENLDADIKRIFYNYSDNQVIPEDKFCSFFAGVPTETLGVILSRYGKMRMEEKEKRFSAELYFSGFNQLSYQGLLEAMGYSKNKFQMLQLANTISYEDIRNFYHCNMKEEDLLAIWLGSTGLMDHLPSSFPVEFTLKWKEIYAKQEFYYDNIPIKWNLFRLRPVNNPAVRLMQILPLIYGTLKGSLFNEIIRLFSYPEGKLKMKDFYSRIEKLFRRESDYLPREWWLGRTRLDTVFINIILPLVSLYAKRNNYSQLSKAAQEVYMNYRKLPENHLTKAMQRYMEEMQIKIARKKAIYQQGLLHVYHNYCQYYNCKECIKLRDKLISEM